jgi:hypothetical protein
VVDLVNAHRGAHGLTPLAVASELEASATWKARHMAQHVYLAHDDPEPFARSVAGRMTACGHGGLWGENIAFGYATPEAVVQAWLDSAGHRANIENPTWAAIGVGAAVSSGGAIYWAQAFGAPAAQPAPPPAPVEPTQREPQAQPAPAAPPEATEPPTELRVPVPEGATLVARAFQPVLGRPRLGRRFAGVVRFAERGVRIAHPRVECRGFVGGRRLAVVWRGVKGGTAGCVWRMPARAHGRVVWGRLRVRSGDRAAARSFYMRLRR